MWITAFLVGHMFAGGLNHCYYQGAGKRWESTIPATLICPLQIQVPVPS